MSVVCCVGSGLGEGLISGLEEVRVWVLCVVCCVGSGLCEGLITGLQEMRVWVLCVVWVAVWVRD